MAVTNPRAHGHRGRLRHRIAVLAAAVALVGTAATATAAGPTPASGPHCAVELTQPAGGGPATIASETCFSTFAEALAFSTGGRVTYWVEGANPPCANGVVWILGGVLDAGWNNVIRSAQGWSGCNHFMHYDLANQQGAVWACVPNCPNMGAMDKRTTSLKWFQ